MNIFHLAAWQQIITRFTAPAHVSEGEPLCLGAIVKIPDGRTGYIQSIGYNMQWQVVVTVRNLLIVPSTQGELLFNLDFLPSEVFPVHLDTVIKSGDKVVYAAPEGEIFGIAKNFSFFFNGWMVAFEDGTSGLYPQEDLRKAATV